MANDTLVPPAAVWRTANTALEVVAPGGLDGRTVTRDEYNDVVRAYEMDKTTRDYDRSAEDFEAGIKGLDDFFHRWAQNGHPGGPEASHLIRSVSEGLNYDRFLLTLCRNEPATTARGEERTTHNSPSVRPHGTASERTERDPQLFSDRAVRR